jgi:alpha-tubulin suppressor-like RCC1 family protein
MWTLDTVLEYEKAGAWPKPVLPRELYAWGRNVVGTLGDGTTVDRSSPVQIGSLTDWSHVSASKDNHSAALKLNGTLWAWGGNSLFGALGDGTTVDKSSPVQIGALTNWSQVSAGTAFTAAVKTDGTLWTWGNGANGRLGSGAVASRSSPVQVGALTDWAKVSAGGTHTTAITVNGALWTWGNGANGLLGSTAVVSRSSPVQVGALTNWSKIDAGVNRTFAIKTDSTLWGWGLAIVGDNSNVSRSSPVQIGALTDWYEASPGLGHSIATRANGTIWSWGNNASGQLGTNNSGTYVSSPVQIGALSNWLQVSAGSSVSSAIKTDGTLWTWGTNAVNQLGDGTTINRSSPIQIGALTNWYQVSARSNFMLALTKG